MVRFLASLILGAGLLLTGEVFAKSENEAIEIPFYVDEGDIHTVQYKFTRMRRNAGVEESATAEIAAKIELKAISEETFDAEWTTLSVSVDGAPAPIEKAVEEGFYIGVPIAYVARYDGAPIEVVDADKIIHSMFADDGPLGTLDNEARKKTRALFTEMDSATLAQVLLRAPTFMSICQSTALVVGELVEYDDELPNAFGGVPFPARGSYLLASVSDEPYAATIEWSQKLDPEKSKEAVMEIVKKLVPAGSGAEIDAQLANLTLDISNSATCTIDRESGWVSWMNYRKDVIFGDNGNSEIYEISVD